MKNKGTVMANPVDHMTPAMKQLEKILSDGKPHAQKDLHRECCGPSSISALHQLMSSYRAVIRRRGEDVLIRYTGRRLHYVQVRYLARNE